MAARPLSVTARELFLKEELAARVFALPDDKRREARAHLDTARTRHIAGESLAAHGKFSEASRALSDAINESLAALDIVGADDAKPLADRARAVLAEHDKVALASFVADASRAHQLLFEAVAPYGLDTRSMRRAQIRRAAAIVAYAIAALTIVVYFATRKVTLSAEASAFHSASFAPSKAVDGSFNTEWLLPNATAGWIELQVSPARVVKKIRLANARNIPYNDRATGNFRVETFYNNAPLFSAESSFPGMDPNLTWREITTDGQKIDKIKVWVRTWYEAGGGFTEITIE
jgi:hypothetical protein